MVGWRKAVLIVLAVLLTACMPPPGSLDRRVDGEWAAERSTVWRWDEGERRWHENISYSTYYKGQLVSRQAYDQETGKPIAGEWVRPPTGMEGDPRLNPVAYYQSRVQIELALNKALWPTLGKEGNLQKDRCGNSAGCRALDEQISRDINRLDLMSNEFNKMAKWPPPDRSDIREASLPLTESRKPAVSLEGGPPGLPTIPQPTITPQPGGYPGGGTYHP